MHLVERYLYPVETYPVARNQVEIYLVASGGEVLKERYPYLVYKYLVEGFLVERLLEKLLERYSVERHLVVRHL